MTIVVLDGHTLNPGDNPWAVLESMARVVVYERTPPDQIIARAEPAEILITNKTPLSSSTLRRLPKLRCIAVTATGYNIVDVAAAAARGVPVCNVPEYGSDAVAQFTFALILELCHQVGRHGRSVSEGDWQRNRDWCYWISPQQELTDKTLGIVGFGRIGRRVGEIANAFGMTVIAHDVNTASPPDYQPFAWRSLAELFAEADIVTLHCPQTHDNVGFVNDALLDRMKDSAFLINAARGGLINERDLAAVLNSGRIAGAAVDVVTIEPIEASNPLLSAKNCLITPHLAWATLEARQRIMRTTAENIAVFLAGDTKNVVNAKALIDGKRC